MGFLRELAAFVCENHVVRDPRRRTYGMTYEFFRDGRQYQVFGLDTMHDGAWFASALMTAHRIDPEGGHLGRAQAFQVPFYTNMLIHSDRIFPHKRAREGQDRKPLVEPVTGWVPPDWDDGAGYDLANGKPFASGKFAHADSATIEREDGRFVHAYGTPSNHLAQRAWIHGVDHGRYRVAVDGGEGIPVYFPSEPRRIIRRLQELALGTVGTWHRVWEEIRCIPSGWRSHNLRVNHGERSDAGNCAHHMIPFPDRLHPHGPRGDERMGADPCGGPRRARAGTTPPGIGPGGAGDRARGRRGIRETTGRPTGTSRAGTGTSASSPTARGRGVRRTRAAWPSRHGRRRRPA